MASATSISVTWWHSTSCFGYSTSNGLILQHKSGELVTSRWGTLQSRVQNVSIRSQISPQKIGDVGFVNTSCQRVLDGTLLTESSQLLKSVKLSTIASELKKDGDDQTVSFPFYAVISNHFCDALESILLRALHGSTQLTNQYMLGNYGPVEESAPQSVLSVMGHLPECLNGEYIQVGPNPKFKPLAKYHWFDGDGMLHGLRIKDGEVTYACRYVRTSRLKQEEYWGGPKFLRMGDLVGFGGLLCAATSVLRQKLGAVDTSKGDSTANTALVYHNGTLFALSQLDMPYAVQILESGDFRTISRHDFDQKLDHPFTAHPKLDPDTGEMFSYGNSCFGGPPYLTYNVISKDGQMGDPVPITLSGPNMMHDFAIAGDYVVFIDSPLHLDIAGMVMKDQFAINHEASKPFRVALLPKYAKNETELRWFEFTSAINFHVANGWQQGDEIVLITCRMPSLDTLRITDACPALHEYRINLKTAESSERRLGEFDSDFPSINDNYTGKKNRYVYATTRTAAVENKSRGIGLVKYDLRKEPKFDKETLQVAGNIAGVFWHGDQRCSLECIFVPRTPGRDSDEDDGYILCHVFDENARKSEVLVIDAKTMSPDPVAVIGLPSRVPYGFHSLFVNEEQLRSQLVGQAQWARHRLRH